MVKFICSCFRVTTANAYSVQKLRKNYGITTSGTSTGGTSTCPNKGGVKLYK